MIIDCIADLHGFYPELEGGDLLLLAGDYTASDKMIQWADFFSWLGKQRYRKKILIAGNHDNFMANGFPQNQKESDELEEIQSFLQEQGEMGNSDFEYLCDSGTEFIYEEDNIELEECGMHPTEEKKIKIWGSPWTTTFPGINPHCCAFTVDSDDELAEKWALIPDDVDILITHSPPLGILDYLGKKNEECGSLNEILAGSASLREVMFRVKPKLMVFGHIHENGGKMVDLVVTKCVNASHVNKLYQPVNKPIRILL